LAQDIVTGTGSVDDAERIILLGGSVDPDDPKNDLNRCKLVYRRYMDKTGQYPKYPDVYS
jgi:hypothetical protein